MILKCKRSVYQQFKKSLSDSRLEYFKRELKKILKKQLEDETSKIEKSFLVVDALCKSMLNPFYESEIMEKAHREHLVPKQIRALNKKTGKTYTTTVYVNPNKQYGLKKYHETDSKGAKIAIAKLMKSVDKCQSEEELYKLVLRNKGRFSDSEGKPLQIVTELRKYVDEKQKNIGKLNTLNNNSKKTEKIQTKEIKLTVEEKEKLDKITSALEKNIVEMPKIEASEENFNNLFKNGIDSPIEHIKIGENQFDKLVAKGREDLLGAMADVIKDPAVIIKTKDNAKIYAKTYQGEKHKKTVVSVIVDKGELHISISTHIERSAQIAKKMDSILYTKIESVHGKKPHGTTPDNSKVSQNNADVKENNKTVNKTVTLKLSDFPAEFSKGKWKKQTQILLDYMNNCKDANPTVMEVYKSFGKLKNNLPFSIHKTNKKLPNGAFCIKGRPVKIRTGWESLEPVEQMLYIGEIDNSNEDLLKKTCSSALHEIMHMIDFSTRPDKNYSVYRSNNIQFTGIINNAKVTEAEIKEVGKFVDELKEERNKHIDKMNEYAAQCKKLNEDFKRGVLSQNEANAKQNDVRKDLAKAYELFKVVDTKTRAIGRLTDIYDALTNGKMRDEKGYGGHGRMYYRTPGNKETEIMANIGSLAVDSPEIMDFLEKRQPDVVKAVYNMFDDILKELNNE